MRQLTGRACWRDGHGEMRNPAETRRKEVLGASVDKGAQVKRSRGRGRRPQQNNSNRTFDSSGPEIKIRGSASHVYEKYLQMARDANSAGDRVMAENYLQHAEHYFRILSAAQAQQQQQQGQPNGGQRPNGGNGMDAGAQPAGSDPSFSLTDGGDDEEDGTAAD